MTITRKAQLDRLLEAFTNLKTKSTKRVLAAQEKAEKAAREAAEKAKARGE